MNGNKTYFGVIIITPEDIRADEASLISQMLFMGVDRVHLRHPGASVDDLRNIIREIPLECHHRLTLHDHFELTRNFPELGLNLNQRNPELPEGRHGLVSRSCHSVVETFLPADYCLLSPVFPSVSKQGYKGNFSDDDLKNIPHNKVFALGGINCERIEAVRRYPFIGVAVLGSVWSKDTDRTKVIHNVTKILKQL